MSDPQNLTTVLDDQEAGTENQAKADGNDLNRAFTLAALKWVVLAVVILILLQNPIPQPWAGMISIGLSGLVLRFNPLKY